MAVSVNSDTFPYERVQTGFTRLRGTEEIPIKILKYLMDLPLPGYMPVDDNNRARVRLMKYLWYDGARPLANPLPTPAEKLSMLFDGDNPVLNTQEEKERHPKGYRIYPQRVWGQSDTEADTILKLYMGRTIAKDNFHTVLGLQFEVLVNVNMENTTRTDATAPVRLHPQPVLMQKVTEQSRPAAHPMRRTAAQRLLAIILMRKVPPLRLLDRLHTPKEPALPQQIALSM